MDQGEQSGGDIIMQVTGNTLTFFVGTALDRFPGAGELTGQVEQGVDQLAILV